MKTEILELNDKIINGEINALDGFIQLKAIRELADSLMKGHQDEAVDEAQKHGAGRHEMNGSTFEVKNAAGRWNFDHLDHIVEAKKLLKEEQDSAKQAFKSKEKGVDMISDGGEIIQPADYTPGKTTIAITLPAF